ncbi:MAG: host specificity factor TipJ family phage tail protein [Rhizomicrobium sp.]
MTVVKIVRDEYAPESEWEVFETERPLEAILDRLGGWPDYARLYHGRFCKSCDVTPDDLADVEALSRLSGPFIAVLHAGEPITTTTLIIAVAIGVAGAIAGVLLRPKIPSPNDQAPSSNNALGDRTNQARSGGRIPDIFGGIEAVPDLLGVPLRLFTDNLEYELVPLCIGRGAYAIDPADILDGGTPVSQISGASVEIYSPNTSPNSGDSPQLAIGDTIGTEIQTVYKINGVNGQTLLPPNYKTYTSGSRAVLRFRYVSAGDGSHVVSTDDDELNFTKFFEVGDSLVIANSTCTDSGHTANLDNDLGHPYTLLAVGPTSMQIDNPATVNSDWNIVNLMASHQTPVFGGIVINGSGLATKDVGPFFVDVADGTGAVLNFVALGGLFKTTGKTNAPVDIDIEIGVTPADASGTATGAEVVTTVTMPGSGVDRSQRGYSAAVSLPGRCLIRATRLTNTDYAYQGTVSDEVKWRDLFVTAPIGVDHFGNVTTIWAKQSVTQAAIGIKERKLTIRNCRRKLPARDGDGFDDGTLVASGDAADIICAIARDPYIGRRSDFELNVPQIRDTIAAVKAYFGTDAAGSFGYSFDDDQTSAEDMIQAVAEACFCEAVRRGSKLELVFEKATDDSTLLLNHRNIMPGTQKRTPMFGRLNRYDGVELNYVITTSGDAPATVRLPADGSATNPQKVDMHGVRDFNVAWWLASRYYNKARYQRLTSEFTATQDALMLTRLERVMIADTTAKFDGMSGEVVAQDGLNLTLSQRTRFADGTDYVMMIQYPDGTVGVIDVTPGPSVKQVVLAEPPAVDLSVDPRNVSRAKYWILPDDSQDFGRAFLITEKSRADQNTYDITAINYDARYYQADHIDPPAIVDVTGGIIHDTGGAEIHATR